MLQYSIRRDTIETRTPCSPQETENVWRGVAWENEKFGHGVVHTTKWENNNGP